MRRLIVAAVLFTVACDAGEAPADQASTEAPIDAAQPGGPAGLGSAVADTAPDDAPPASAAPAILFEHSLELALGRSREAYDALLEVCRRESGRGCRIAASDIRMLGARDAFGDVTLEIDRPEAGELNRVALRVVRAASAAIVESRTHDVPPPPPPPSAADAPADPERVRLLFHYLDPRSGLDRGFDRVASNVGATAGLLFLILGSAAPWLLIAWLLVRLNGWNRRRKDEELEAARAAKEKQAKANAARASRVKRRQQAPKARTAAAE